MTNLILLLSAMLSALIGVGPSARAQQVPVAVASVAHEQAIVRPAPSVAARPIPSLPGIAALMIFGAIALLVVPTAVPAWKMRRRE